MKILAILALVATIAGAGAVLYGVNTLRPQVVQTAADETRAQDAVDTFDDMVMRLETTRLAENLWRDGRSARGRICAFVTLYRS